MLELYFIRENKEKVIKGLEKRNYTDTNIVGQVIAEDEIRRTTQKEMDDLKAALNKASKEIGRLYGSGQQEAAEKMKAEVAGYKGQIQGMEEKLRESEGKLETMLLAIPNVPHQSVPSGKGEEDNEVYQVWEGPMPTLPENALPHWELGKKYNILDFDLGVKITGSGFPVFRGKGARLQRALIHFFLDEATAAGYEEIIPPHLVNADTARATGQLPDKEGQMYHATKDDLYLIPTAEVPVTNILRDEILSEDDFPVKYTAYTPCFRREAGSYGKDVKGLNRVHQFDKVEIVHIQHPEKSYAALEEMVRHVEGLLQKLELPFRILRLCGGDLGFTSALTFDFEVFSAAQERWLEVSSVSNFETYQSNRLKLRYRDVNKKTQLAHTLNGSALALARIVAALLENNQTTDGITIPQILQPYTGFEKIS